MPRGKKSKRILFIVYKHYETDPRPQREAAALMDRGYHVDVICLHLEYSNFQCIQHKNLKLHTIRQKKARSTKLRYFYEYFVFLLFATFKGLQLYIKNRYPVVQVFVMPEILTLTCVIQKLFGAKIIIDWEDPSVEVYQTIFNIQDGLLMRLIKLFEKLAVKLSNAVITPNQGFKNAFVRRGLPEEKIDIVMNLPDARIFKPEKSAPEFREKHPPCLLYNGAIIPRHGLDVIIETMKIIGESLPDVRLTVLGEGHNSPYHLKCKADAEKFNLNHRIDWLEPVGIEEIPALLCKSVCLIIPNKDTPFTRINLPTRIMEAGSLGVPVAAPDLPGIKEYFDPSEVCFFKPDDPEDMAEQIVSLLKSKEKMKSMIRKNFEKCTKMEWETQYTDLVESYYQS